VVARIAEETLRRRDNGTLYGFGDKGVIEFTGPAVWTDIIFQYFNDDRYFDMEGSKGVIDWQNFTGMEAPKRVGDVVILPITSFSPGVQQMGAKDYDDPMAFVKHDFEGEWPAAVSSQPCFLFACADQWNPVLLQVPGNPKTFVTLANKRTKIETEKGSCDRQNIAL
jgi:hypothetical protein